jgi:hypothetical protein
MLRSDWVLFNDLLRAVKPTLAQMPRGRVNIDAASLAAGYGYAYADLTHLPDIMGLRVCRLASLADGKYTYINDTGGGTLASN